MSGIISPELALITLSVIIAFFSYTGQRRTQMRESLEQLDDTNLGSTNKIAILLHDYSLLPRRTKLIFRVYYAPQTGGQGSRAKPPFEKLPDDEGEKFKNDIENTDKKEVPSITKIDESDYELIITVASIDPIAVRRAADHISLLFANRYSDRF